MNEHEGNNSATKDTFAVRWLSSVGLSENTPIYREILSFLDAVGTYSNESLNEIATSFQDLIIWTAGTDAECKPIALMTLRNLLWHHTGIPSTMDRESTLADVLVMLKHNKSALQDTHIDGRQGAIRTPKRLSTQGPGRRVSDICQPRDLARTTKRNLIVDMNGSADGNGEYDSPWGAMPRLTCDKDDAYRSQVLNEFGDDAVDPYAAEFTAEDAVTEAKMGGKLMTDALRNLSPFSGGPEGWLKWKASTLADFTFAGGV